MKVREEKGELAAKVAKLEARLKDAEAAEQPAGPCTVSEGEANYLPFEV